MFLTKIRSQKHKKNNNNKNIPNPKKISNTTTKLTKTCTQQSLTCNQASSPPTLPDTIFPRSEADVVGVKLLSRNTKLHMFTLKAPNFILF